MKSGVSGRGGGSAKAMNILSGVMSRLIVRSIRPRTPTLTISLCGVRGLPNSATPSDEPQSFNTRCAAANT